MYFGRMATTHKVYKNSLPVLLILIFFTISCGNRKITYYLTRIGPTEVNGHAKTPLLLSRLYDKDDSAKDEDGRIGIRIYTDVDASILLIPMDIVDIDEFFARVDKSLSGNTRLPSSYYFKYYVSNIGSQPITLDFYNSYFEDEFGNQYHPFSEKEFKKHFTSPSYDWINYSKLHAVYQIETVEGRIKNKIISKKFHHRIQVEPGSKVFQILSYKFLSLRSKVYDLHFTIKVGKKIKKIKTPALLFVFEERS